MALAERLHGTIAAGNLGAGAQFVGALAFSGRLGAELVRLRSRSGHDPATAVLLLTKAVRHENKGVGFGIARRIAAGALAEWLEGTCRVCEGTRFVKRDQMPVTCQSCNGSGMRRFNDGERKRALGLDPERPMPRIVAQHYDPLIGRCETAYRTAIGAVRRQLGG